MPKKPKETNKPEEVKPLLPDYVHILPFAFGFTFHSIFIQGTIYLDKRNKTINAMGILPNDIEYSSLNDLVVKTKWNTEQSQEFLKKINVISDKQQKGIFK